MSNTLNGELGSLVKSGGGKIHTGPFGSQLHASDYVAEGIPCIMPANMKNSRVDLSNIAYITVGDAQRLSKYIVKENDIVYSRRGDVTQKALIRKNEEGYFCGTGCLLLRPGKKFDARFLTYYLSIPKIQSWIVSQAVGATMPNLNTGILSSIPFHGPEKLEQERVANVLSAIEGKIELNNRINAELEAMAKTLYDYWFVQFDFPDANGKPYKTSGGKMVYNPTLKREIPEGWEVNKLSKYLTLGSGFPFDSSTYLEEGKYKVITIKNVQSEGLITDKTDYVDSIPKGLQDFCVLNIGDILMSLTGNVGRVCLVNEEHLLLNQRVGKFVCDKKWKNYFYLYFLRPESRARLEKIATGSSQKNLSPIDAVNFLHVYPSDELLSNFNEATKCFIEQIAGNSLENRKLTSLCDWILPMLMNGQVTVGEAN